MPTKTQLRRRKLQEAYKAWKKAEVTVPHDAMERYADELVTTGLTNRPEVLGQGGKMAPNKEELPLIMECTVEDLTEVQLNHYSAARKAYEDAIKKANDLYAQSAGPARPSSPPPADDVMIEEARPAAAPVVSTMPVLVSALLSTSTPQPAVPLLPLPLAVNAPFSGGANISSEIPPPQRISLPNVQPAVTAAAPSTTPEPPVVTVPDSQDTAGTGQTSRVCEPAAGITSASGGGSSSGSSSGDGGTAARSASSEAAAPTEDSPASSAAPEQQSHDLQIKTYPALHVTLRTPFALTETSRAQYKERRSFLDLRVKKLLILTPSQFTEWLIQSRLVRAIQFCPIHTVTWAGHPRKLRLGMFTDSGKLAHSGGYVWVKNCCRPKFLSVYFGSLFDASKLLMPNIQPMAVLKLMYHWACQTPLYNVTQWLKLPASLVDEVYGLLRAVCMLKTEETMPKLGGGGSVVQVGLVSLGTSGPDGLNKNVKVEVLGVKDVTMGEIRLVGFEPRIKNRIRSVVGAVQEWVHEDSHVMLDPSISPLPFRSHFARVDNAPIGSKDVPGNIMQYLRRHLPRMFQVSLVHLRPPVICQFIAEITWREKFGRDPSATFTNLVAHVGTLTQQCEGSLIDMLNKVLMSTSMDLKRKPRKQTLASRPDSQPEFPGDHAKTETAGSAATDEASDDASSELSGAGAERPQKRRRGASQRRRCCRRNKRRSSAELAAEERQASGCFFKLAALTDLTLPDVHEQACWECKLPLSQRMHLTGVYACKRCRYTTSCEKIFPVHQRVFHSKGVAPVFSMGRPIVLDWPMSCVCGYSTDSGNRLAAHMIRCESRTARPAAERTLVNLEDSE